MTPASPTSTRCCATPLLATQAHVTFIDGPDEWCDDEVIATDVDYRWDGVHVYQRGAKLVFETIAPALLAIPIDRR
jgi:hypothetical protein